MDLYTIYKEGKGNVIAFAESRIGGRPENQDSYSYAYTDFGYVVTVCDGMGGGPGGKTASTIAVKEIILGISEANKEEEITNIIIKAVRRANMAIIEAAQENTSLTGMGSTATVLLVSEEAAYVAHVGDSRVYQMRGNNKVFRTFDHSMVFEMVSQGVITEEQARLSAQSNIITRALGIKADVEVDVVKLPYEKGDRFILCSDGIHGSMEESALIKMLGNRKGKLGAITDDISTYIDNLGRTSGGGHDNLTIAIVETTTNSKFKSKMSKQTKIAIYCLSALLAVCLCLNVMQYKESANNSETKQVKELRSELDVLKKDVHDRDSIIQCLQDSINTINDKAKVEKSKIEVKTK